MKLLIMKFPKWNPMKKRWIPFTLWKVKIKAIRKTDPEKILSENISKADWIWTGQHLSVFLFSSEMPPRFRMVIRSMPAGWIPFSANVDFRH